MPIFIHAPELSIIPSRDLDNSRPFDESRTSDHSAIRDLARLILQRWFPAERLAASAPTKVNRAAEAETLVTVFLANLYAVWRDDQERSLALSLSNRGYTVKSRYNPLRVSNRMIVVAKVLIDAGIIEMAAGFFDRTTQTSRLTRVWPSPWLAEAFAAAEAQLATVRRAAGTEVIILRNEAREAVPYEDNDQTNSMRAVLTAYNARLAKMSTPEKKCIGWPE